jgi:hypothetical protein
MLFPKPVSAKTRVRLNLARITADLGDLYGSEISGLELEMEKGKQISDSDIRARQAIYRGVFSKIFVSLCFFNPGHEWEDADKIGEISNFITSDGVCEMGTWTQRPLAS